MQDKKKDVLLKRVLNYSSFFFAAVSVLYILWMWNKMPQQIPSHYNIRGIADDFSGKSGCIVLAVIQCVLVISLRGSFPLVRAIYDDGKKKTEKQERLNGLGAKIISFETAFLSVCFTYMIYKMVNGSNLGSLFMPIFIIGMLVPVAVYNVNMCKGSR